MSPFRSRGGRSTVEHRHEVEEDHPNLAGVPVREEDVEPVKGIRTIAVLFRGMAIILLVLMVLQVFFAATSTVPLSVGVVTAEAVRLIIFAGLLWGVGDLAVIYVKSHYDLRATRILTARIAHMVQQIGEADGKLPPSDQPDVDRTA
jgi:hypothetical protein